MADRKPADGEKKPNRRLFLKGAGVVTLLVAGGVVYRGVDRGAFGVSQGPAYEPWRDWQSAAHRGTPMALAAAGILAANPHNTQPWLFDVTEERIVLYADYSRNLGTFDPYLREMHLGLGCAVENMAVAAGANGFKAEVALETGRLRTSYDTAGGDGVAVLSLTRAETASHPLYDAIAKRHTDRGAYDRERGIGEDAIRELTGAAAEWTQTAQPNHKLFLYTDGEQREAFDTLTVDATAAIIADKEMERDSGAWMRMTKEAVEENRDGITLESAGLSPAILMAAKMLPPLSAEASHQSWLNSTRDVHLPSAPVTGYIAVRDLYDIRQTLEAGRLWQRMHLKAAQMGVSLHPINQSVEMVDRENQTGVENGPYTARVAALVEREGWHPTFAFRAGYPCARVLPSPRRPLESVVV